MASNTKGLFCRGIGITSEGTNGLYARGFQNAGGAPASPVAASRYTLSLGLRIGLSILLMLTIGG